MLLILINIMLIICIIFLMGVKKTLEQRLDELNKEVKYLRAQVYIFSQDRD